MNILKRTFGIGFVAMAFALLISSTALAHVVVRPGEVKTGERVTFAMSVPNEHDTPVVGVRLVAPEGLTSVRPFAKAGWNIEVVKTGEGEDITATEIKWTSAGGTVPVDLKDEFLFGAMAPASDSELQWKAYETYADGMVVAWDQAPSDAEDNKPYSVTKVVSQTEAEATVARAEQAAADADKAADRAMYTAIIALVVAAFSLVMILRDQK